MTSRPTDGDKKPQAEKPDLAEFSRFKVMDSYSIFAIGIDGGGGSPKGQHHLSKRQLVELGSQLSE